MTFAERMRYFMPAERTEDAELLLEGLCRARVRLGLQSGRLWKRARAAQDGPAWTWECDFPSSQALQDDVVIRNESTEVESISQQMRELCDRIERDISEGRGTLHNGLSAEFTNLSLVPTELTFESAGRQLKGYLYLPSAPPPYSTVIFNHGSGLEKGTDEPVYPGVAATLLSWGLAAFLPHRHGYGESPGPGWRDDCPDEEFSDAYNAQLLGRLDRESNDVVAAFRHLCRLPEVKADRVAVMGTSLGGINSLFSSVKEPRIRCAD